MTQRSAEDQAALDAKDTAYIRDFILGESGQDQPEGLRSFCFILSHQSERGREPIQSKALAQDLESLDRLGDRREELAEKFAKLFLDIAQRTVRTYARPQSFWIFAKNTLEPEIPPLNQCPLQLDPPPGMEGGFGAETPDAAGRGAMDMRLIEVLSRDYRAAMSDARQSTARANDQQRDLLAMVLARYESLENRHAALLVSQQDALDRKSERDVNAQAKLFEIHRTERWWRMAEAELPRVLDMLGVGGPLMSLVKSFTKEELREAMPLVLGLFESKYPEKKPLLLAALDTHLKLGEKIQANRAKQAEVPVVREIKKDDGVVPDDYGNTPPPAPPAPATPAGGKKK